MSSCEYIGYHGTSVEAHARIKLEGFKCSRREDHWLGNGIYFFLDDCEEARWFSSQCMVVKHYNQTPCVLKAEIKAERKKVLNADTTLGREKFIKAFYAIKKHLNANNVKIKNNTPQNINRIRCIVFDSIKDVDIIIKVFTHNKTSSTWKDESAAFLQPTHTQICVRDEGCIRSLNVVNGGRKYGT